MESSYLLVLVQEIRAHKLIKQEHQLTSPKWNKSAFVTCSKIIGETLLESFSDEDMMKYGTAVSYKTLQSIFNNRYKIKYPIDPRSLSTLTKLVKFVGFNSWNEFTQEVEQSASMELVSNDPEAQVINFVKQAVSTSFEAISGLTTSILESYYDKQHSAFKLLNEFITHNQTERNCISNPSNPSTFEILDIEVEQIDKNKARVKTKEYWLLCLWNSEGKKYATRVKDINEHLYTVVKENKSWMIINDVTLSDKYELQSLKSNS